MIALTANLKLFFQRPYLLVCVVFPAICLIPFWLGPFAKNPPDSAFYVFAITMFLFFVGNITSSIHSAILTKPFAFLLPEQGRVLRQTAFIVGGAAAFFISFLYLAFTGWIADPLFPWIMASATAAAMVFYLLITGFALALMPRFRMIGFQLYLMLFLLFVGVSGSVFYLVFKSLIFHHPFAVLLVAGAVIACLWKIMASAAFLQRCRGSLALSPNIRKSRKRISSTRGVRERLFLSLMSTHRSKWSRVVWGALYTRLGSIRKWYWYFTAAIVIVWIFPAGYLHSFLLLGFMAVLGTLSVVPINNTLLLGMGRRERLVAGIAVAWFETAIILATYAIAIGAAWAISNYMPFDYRVPSMRLLYLPLILLPLNQTYPLAITQKHKFLGILMICVSVPVFFFFFLKAPLFSHAVAIPLILLANGVLVGLLAYECYCQDLGTSKIASMKQFV